MTRDDIMALREAQSAAQNIEVTDEGVDSFISDFDSTGDGTVTRQEFIAKFIRMFDDMI